MWYKVKKGKKVIATVNAESCWHAIDIVLSRLQARAEKVNRKQLSACL